MTRAQCRNLHVFEPTAIEDMTRAAKCPKCSATCYLPGHNPRTIYVRLVSCGPLGNALVEIYRDGERLDQVSMLQGDFIYFDTKRGGRVAVLRSKKNAQQDFVLICVVCKREFVGRTEDQAWQKAYAHTRKFRKHDAYDERTRSAQK